MLPACALAVMLGATAGRVTADEAFTLAVRGERSVCSLVVDENAPPIERYAARELQTYVKRLTGVELPLVAAATGRVVRVGGPGLGDEGFRLVQTNDVLTVDGRGMGALYGVYELLERFGGCAWYSPRFEVVPALDALRVPRNLNISEKPAFRVRETSVNGWSRHRSFLLKNKLSVFGGAEIWGGGDSPATRYRLDPKLGKCHTFWKLLPVDEWYAKHPEYFAEYEGRRQKLYTQLCLANPEVRRLCTQVVLRQIAENYPKGIRYYGVSQNDWRTFCQCAACRAVDVREKSPAGSLIAFVNAIAEEVEKHYPDVFIQTLAYVYSRRPPATIRPRRNVHVCFCTMACDFFHPIATGRSRENRDTQHYLRRWRGDWELGVWDYVTDFTCYLYTWPNFRSLRPNLAHFRDAGVLEVLEQGGGAGVHDVWTDLRGWLVAKWLWNPDRDEEELLTRAFKDNFGPAAAEVRYAFETLHDVPRDTRRFPMGCYEEVTCRALPDSTLDAAARIFSFARRRAAATPYAVRVDEAALPVDFTWAHRRGRYVIPRGPTPPPVAEAVRAAAARVINMDGTNQCIRFAADTAADAFHRRRMQMLARGELPRTAPRLLELEEWNLVGALPTRFKYVDDPEAQDGRAIQIDGALESCSARFQLDHVALETSRRYAVWARIKVAEGAVREGRSAYGLNIEEGVSKDSVTGRWPEDCERGRYFWQCTGAFKPAASYRLWIGLGNGPHPPTIWIDKIIIERLAEATESLGSQRQ